MTATAIDYCWDDYRALVPINTEPIDDKAFAMREKIILQHLELTRRVAAKMMRTMPNHIDTDDLESYAKIGLMRAISRYNHQLGVPFEAYAMTNMRSVILDGIRSLDWAPRSLRRKERELFNAHTALRHELEHEPTKEDLALKLGVTIAEVNDTRQKSSAASTAYLEENTEVVNRRTTSLDTEEVALVQRLRDGVACAVQKLPFREAVVIALHYYEGLKLADVAEALGVSEVKAGMLHTEAITKIWESIAVLRKE